MDHVVSTNIKSNHVNDFIGNELKFDSINSPAKNPVKDTLPIVYIILGGSKKSIHTLNLGSSLLWDSGVTNSMIKCDHIRANKVECSIYYGSYKPYIMQRFHLACQIYPSEKL